MPGSVRELRWMWIGLLAGALLDPSASVAAATHAAPSQDYLIRVWRSDQGLPHDAVTSLVQTPDGYIWVGTRSGGLARFDGVRFVTFNPHNTPQLRDVEIQRLALDSTGTMWITTGNRSITTWREGRFRLVRSQRARPRWHPQRLIATYSDGAIFRAARGSFYRVPRRGPPDVAEQLTFDPPLTQPRMLSQDRDGGLWYLSAGGRLARFVNGRSGRVPANELSLAGPIRAVTTDASGRTWIATATRLAVWGGEAFVDCTPTNGPPPAGIEHLVATGDGGMWVRERDRLRRCKAGAWVAETRAMASWMTNTTFATQWFGDSDGGLWVAEDGVGLWHVKANGEPGLLTADHGLPGRFLRDWMQDRAGNVWIGTLDGGLACIRKRVFKAFDQSAGLPGEAVQSVCEDAQGAMWAGMVSGRLARQQADRFVEVPLPPNPGPPIQNVTVFPEADGAVWVGSRLGGIAQWRNQEWVRPFPRTALPLESARVLFGDHAGTLWIGVSGNLFTWQDGRLTRCGEAQGFSTDAAISGISEAEPGTVWVSTGPGELWRCQHGRFTGFHPPPAWPFSRCAVIAADAGGVVWMGTLGGGLVRFADGQFTRLTTREGLPHDHITQLLDDGLGNLWAGTPGGIFRAAKSDLADVASGRARRVQCSAYGLHEGLPALECSARFHPACWRSRDGRLWFATIKGLACVNPREVEAPSLPPRVWIEELRVDGIGRGFDPRRRLTVEPGRHYVQFRFTGLDFTAPDKVSFRWKLEGAERDWQEGGHQRVVGYGPLAPGEYRFRVLAANNSGVWNEPGAMLAFTVRPHFWETWWFKTSAATALVGGLVLLAVAALRRGYLRRLELLERRQQLERERSRIAQDLHDDLGTTLTQISLLSALLGRSGTTTAEVQELTQEIRARAREMVGALNEIVWAVNPKNDSLNEVLGYLGNFAQQFLRTSPVRCRLDFPESIRDQPLSSEARHHLFLAFKEALNNAAKHAAASEVRIRARQSGARVVIEVADNGCGFDAAQRAASGNGLSNMRQRMEKLGGRCEVSTQPGQGTTIEFHLPEP